MPFPSFSKKYVSSAEGSGADPEKITSVKQWLVPSTLKDLRLFLGFCSSYRRFIEGFSKLAGPLHDLVNAFLIKDSPEKAKQLLSSC